MLQRAVSLRRKTRNNDEMRKGRFASHTICNSLARVASSNNTRRRWSERPVALLLVYHASCDREPVPTPSNIPTRSFASTVTARARSIHTFVCIYHTVAGEVLVVPLGVCRGVCACTGRQTRQCGHDRVCDAICHEMDENITQGTKQGPYFATLKDHVILNRIRFFFFSLYLFATVHDRHSSFHTTCRESPSLLNFLREKTAGHHSIVLNLLNFKIIQASCRKDRTFGQAGFATCLVMDRIRSCSLWGRTYL